MPKRPAPIHPGEILLHEFLEPMGISQYRLAKDVSVPARRIHEIVHGKRAITSDTAHVREFWMNLQTRCDVELEPSEAQPR